MDKLHIKPALNSEGKSLRVVNTEGPQPYILPEGGATVVPSLFWHRRLACGDVVEVKAQAKKGAKPDAD